MQQQQHQQPHYENIYEPIAIAPANEQQQQQQQQQHQQQQQPMQAQPTADVNNAPNANAQNLNNNMNNVNNNNNNNSNNNNSNNNMPPRAAANMNYRNDLHERNNVNNNGYDVPRSVRSGLGFRRNFPLDGMSTGNRFGAAAARCAAASNFYANANANCQRQRSFDDTESQNYYNVNCQPSLRYENIYEQIRDEPIYRNTGTGARLYGRLNVIGHGIGRIERHLSSSCGNIDHYNLGGHYAVLGHSHFGTVGHIRLNAGAPASACNGVLGGNVTGGAFACGGAAAAAGVANAGGPKDGNSVKNSSSSFFSCLHGENSQSMGNVYRTGVGAGAGAAAAAAMAGFNGSAKSVCNGGGGGASATGGTPNSSKERESRAVGTATIASGNGNAIEQDRAGSSSGRQTGAIPKIKALNLGGSSKNGAAQNANGAAEKSLSLKNALSKKSSTAASAGANAQPTPAAAAAVKPSEHSTLNRISKSSLQWLLVNRWLPLWISGQGPDCKVIDFNFMFSRDCVGCDDAAPSAAQLSSRYGTSRLGVMAPQDLVRYNAHADTTESQMSSLRRENMRPLHNTLNRLREAEQSLSNRRRDAYCHEDPSYENVHVQWQNGFEFGRSRDYEHSYPQQQQQQQQQQRPQLHRARSESPNFNNQPRRMRTNSAAAAAAAVAAASTAPPPSSSTAKFADPFRKYELNVDNNTFRPKLARIEQIDNADVSTCTSPPPQSAAPALLTAAQPTSPPPPPPTSSGNQLQLPNDLELDLEGAVGGAAAIVLPAAAIADNPIDANTNTAANYINDNETEVTKTKLTTTTQAKPNNNTNNSNNNNSNSNTNNNTNSNTNSNLNPNYEENED